MEISSTQALLQPWYVMREYLFISGLQLDWRLLGDDDRKLVYAASTGTGYWMTGDELMIQCGVTGFPSPVGCFNALSQKWTKSPKFTPNLE